MIRRPPRSTHCISSAASDVYKRQVIICHDSTLDRTTNRTGRYDDLTAADLAGIDAGGWFSPRFVGEPLPTLSDLIDLMNDAGLNANIEIKPNETGKEATLRLIDGVIAQLERLRPDVKVIVSSFSCLLYTSPSPRDLSTSRMPSSA